jgi:hypothetical protein
MYIEGLLLRLKSPVKNDPQGELFPAGPLT